MDNTWRVNDVSVSGMSVLLSKEKAERLEGVDKVRVRFVLRPGQGEQ